MDRTRKCCKQKTYARLMQQLNPLDATLTKNQGEGMPWRPSGRTSIPVRCLDLSPLFLTLSKTPGVRGYSSHSGIPNLQTFQPANFQTPLSYFFTRSFSRFFNSLMNSCTSLKSMYTDANRTYATLSSFFSRCIIISPISVVVSSRSVASCTTPSISSTIASSFGVATGRFSQAFNNPCKIFCRSNRSRLPSFLITMYGISSIRSYVVNRRSHFRHSRRRRMVSPVRPSRESITLSSRCPQKGHFTPAFLPCRPVQRLVPHFRARQCHPVLAFRVSPILAIYPERLLRGSAAESPQRCIQQTSPATAQSPPPPP